MVKKVLYKKALEQTPTTSSSTGEFSAVPSFATFQFHTLGSMPKGNRGPAAAGNYAQSGEDPNPLINRIEPRGRTGSNNQRFENGPSHHHSPKTKSLSDRIEGIPKPSLIHRMGGLPNSESTYNQQAQDFTHGDYDEPVSPPPAQATTSGQRNAPPTRPKETAGPTFGVPSGQLLPPANIIRNVTKLVEANPSLDVNPTEAIQQPTQVEQSTATQPPTTVAAPAAPPTSHTGGQLGEAPQGDSQGSAITLRYPPTENSSLPSNSQHMGEGADIEPVVSAAKSPDEVDRMVTSLRQDTSSPPPQSEPSAIARAEEENHTDDGHHDELPVDDSGHMNSDVEMEDAEDLPLSSPLQVPNLPSMTTRESTPFSASIKERQERLRRDKETIERMRIRELELEETRRKQMEEDERLRLNRLQLYKEEMQENMRQLEDKKRDVARMRMMISREEKQILALENLITENEGFIQQLSRESRGRDSTSLSSHSMDTGHGFQGLIAAPAPRVVSADGSKGHNLHMSTDPQIAGATATTSQISPPPTINVPNVHVSPGRQMSAAIAAAAASQISPVPVVSSILPTPNRGIGNPLSSPSIDTGHGFQGLIVAPGIGAADVPSVHISPDRQAAPGTAASSHTSHPPVNSSTHTLPPVAARDVKAEADRTKSPRKALGSLHLSQPDYKQEPQSFKEEVGTPDFRLKKEEPVDEDSVKLEPKREGASTFLLAPRSSKQTQSSVASSKSSPNVSRHQSPGATTTSGTSPLSSPKLPRSTWGLASGEGSAVAASLRVSRSGPFTDSERTPAQLYCRNCERLGHTFTGCDAPGGPQHKSHVSKLSAGQHQPVASQISPTSTSFKRPSSRSTSRNPKKARTSTSPRVEEHVMETEAEADPWTSPLGLDGMHASAPTLPPTSALAPIPDFVPQTPPGTPPPHARVAGIREPSPGESPQHLRTAKRGGLANRGKRRGRGRGVRGTNALDRELMEDRARHETDMSPSRERSRSPPPRRGGGRGGRPGFQHQPSRRDAALYRDDSAAARGPDRYFPPERDYRSRSPRGRSPPRDEPGRFDDREAPVSGHRAPFYDSYRPPSPARGRFDYSPPTRRQHSPDVGTSRGRYERSPPRHVNPQSNGESAADVYRSQYPPPQSTPPGRSWESPPQQHKMLPSTSSYRPQARTGPPQYQSSYQYSSNPRAMMSAERNRANSGEHRERHQGEPALLARITNP